MPQPQAPKTAKKPFSAIFNKSKPTQAELILYDQIGTSFWEEGITLKQFKKALDEIPSSVTEITVRINSPGGSVFEGMGMYNLLKEHKATIKTRVDGLAASIASVIALAGDEVVFGEGSMYMIHKPWSGMYGNSDDYVAEASRLDKIEYQMINIYRRKSSLTEEEIETAIRAETWYTAEEALEAGFATAIEGEAIPVAASALAAADKWFRRPPSDQLKALQDRGRAQAAALMDKVGTILNRV